MNRLLPQPVLSLCLWLIWLLLNNSVAPGLLVLGAALALAVPLFTVRFRPDRPRLHRPLKRTFFSTLLRGIRYLVVLLWDIAVANLVVARLILDPTRRIRPAFIRLPLDLCDNFAIVVLADTISLTPGTVSADLSIDQRILLIHVLDVEDEAQLIAHIKQRYERPLMEIFEC
jgi:multicomponent K+:H+ antiporter subunit E